MRRDNDPAGVLQQQELIGGLGSGKKMQLSGKLSSNTSLPCFISRTALSETKSPTKLSRQPGFRQSAHFPNLRVAAA